MRVQKDESHILSPDRLQKELNQQAARVMRQKQLRYNAQNAGSCERLGGSPADQHWLDRWKGLRDDAM